ncbi:MAG TPA: LamG domain-containing protein [Parafilimonas sp.]|nr:LamG domain-containing protein [Parafilimonas sp.]
MKKNTTNLFIFYVLAFSAQFMSCQKDKNINNVISNVGIDKSIGTLPVDSSLVAWYTFSNGSLSDKSGNKNKIIFNSATLTNSKGGKPNSAYYFDGSSSFMQVANSPSLNPDSTITLAALIKPMGFYAGQCHANRILAKLYDANSRGIYLLGFDDQLHYDYKGCDKPVKTGRENFYASYGNSTAATGVNDTTQYIKLDKWYFIVYTYNGIYSNLYINNVLVNSVKKKDENFIPNDYDLYIGKTPSPNFPYYFNGVIDEIRIYNRALSFDEVLGLSNLMGKDN